MTTLILSYDESHFDNYDYINRAHPSTEAGKFSAWFEAVEIPAGTTYRLHSVKFYLKKTGSPDAYLQAQVFATTGTYGTNMKPTGAYLAASDVYNMSGLTGSYQLITFTFTGTSQIILTPGSYYALACVCTGGATINDSDHAIIGFDQTASTFPGNDGYYDLSGWAGWNFQDLIFYLYGQDYYPPITPSACSISTTGKSKRTFGLETYGDGLLGSIATDYKYCSRFQLPDNNAEIEKLTVYLSSDNYAGRVRLKGVIYSDSSNAPSALLATTQEVGVIEVLAYNQTLVDLPFMLPIYLDAGAYWLGFIEALDLSTAAQVSKHTVTAGSAYNADTYADGAANPFGTVTAANTQISIYATYYISAITQTVYTGHTVIQGVVAGSLGGAGTIQKEAMRWQEKVFYTAGRYWAFWVDHVWVGGDGYESWFSSSADNGVTWDTPTLYSSDMLETSGENIQVILDTNNYCHVFAREYIPADGGSVLTYRRGQPQTDGTITWTAAKNSFWSPAHNNMDFYACIDSYGYPWVTWGLLPASNSADVRVWVTLSDRNDGIWNTAATFPQKLSPDSDGTWNTNNFIVPLKNGKLYAFYFKGGDVIKGKFYNGASWSAEETCSTSKIIIQYASAKETWSRCCAVDDDENIHLVFLDDGGATTSCAPFSHNIIYANRTLAGGWSSETVVESGLADGASPGVSVISGAVTVFWAGGPIKSMILGKQVGDSDLLYWVDERTDGLPVEAAGYYGDYDGIINPFVKVFNNSFGLLYLTGTAPLYAIKFAMLPTEGPAVDATIFDAVADVLKTTFGVTTWNVTRSKLVLGDQDATTGWYEKLYYDSTIEMVIATKSTATIAHAVGAYVKLDAVGFANSYVKNGDVITDSYGNYWLVRTVQPMYAGDKLKFYQCDLTRKLNFDH